MANLKELRRRIKSVSSTARVTKAMQMIAAAKMRRAQQKVVDGRPYSEKIHSILSHLNFYLKVGFAFLLLNVKEYVEIYSLQERNIL